MIIPNQDPSAGPNFLHNAHGIEQMIDQLIANNPEIIAANRNRYVSTKAIYVRRNGILIGNLYDITRTWDVYSQEIDAWATRNNQPRRVRRSKPGSGLRWRKGRFVKKARNGRWLPVADQLQLCKRKAHRRER